MKIEYLMPVFTLSAIGLVFVTVILIDRVREPFRNPNTPFVVYDRRTYRYGQRRINVLLERGDMRSRVYLSAIMFSSQRWLRGEIHTGRRSQAALRAAQLERLELQMEQSGLTVERIR